MNAVSSEIHPIDELILEKSIFWLNLGLINTEQTCPNPHQANTFFHVFSRFLTIFSEAIPILLPLKKKIFYILLLLDIEILLLGIKLPYLKCYADFTFELLHQKASTHSFMFSGYLKWLEIKNKTSIIKRN